MDLLPKNYKKREKMHRNEELELIKQWKSEKNQYIVDKLLESYMPSIVFIAKSYGYNGFVDDLDAIHEGIIGFLVALYKFDPSKNTKFLTYAWNEIDNRIERHYEREKRLKNPYISLSLEEYEGELLMDDLEDWFIEQDMCKKIESTLRNALIKRKKGELYHQILSKLLWGVPLTELEEEYHISRAGVSQLKKKLFAIFRKDEDVKNLFKEMSSENTFCSG
jgi:RNA polymerase sigma factor (sigma-70 family)